MLVESLHQHKQSGRKLEGVYCEASVCELVEHQRISNEELLALDVDLLIPAALEGAIHADNAAAVRAPLIAEVANGPIESEAEQALRAAGVVVLPDVLTNAGGVTVSYFEWVQNRQGYPWSLEQVRERLEETLAGAFERTWEIHEEREVSLRDAAYMVALKRLADAIEAQGTRKYFDGG